MVVRVICKLMTARSDGVQHARIGGNAAAGDEKRRLDAALCQRVQQIERIIAGAVVKCNCHQLCAAVLRGLVCQRAERKRQRENGAQHHAEQKTNDLFHNSAFFLF